MEFYFVDFLDAGCVSITCDCGAEFFHTGKAIDHVLMWHCPADFRGQETRMLDCIACFLSPNPVHFFERKAEQTGANRRNIPEVAED